MHSSLNIEILCHLFDYLSFPELLKLTQVNTHFLDLTTRYLIYQKTPPQILRKQSTRNINSSNSRLRLFKSIFNRRIVVLQSQKTLEAFKETKFTQVIPNFAMGTIIETCKVFGNNFYIQIFPNTLYYCNSKLLKTTKPKLNLDLKNGFLKIEHVFKFDVSANNLFYLTTEKQVFMRFCTEAVLGEIQSDFEFHPDLSVFNETDFGIHSIHLSEQTLVFMTTSFSIYLIEGTESLTSVSWRNQDYVIYKIDADPEIRQICPSSQIVFLTAKNCNRLWKVAINKNELNDLVSRFSQRESQEFLTLPADCKQFSEMQEMGIVSCFRNLFLLEIKTRPVSFDDFSQEDVISLFHKINLKDFDKVILHNRITGKELGGFNEKNLGDVFGIRPKSHSIVRILDEVKVRRNVRTLPSSLFLHGCNSNRLFGKDNNLHNFSEIPLPVFDINEEIESSEIGSYNLVLKTTKNRSFISFVVENEEEIKRKKSSLVIVPEELEIIGKVSQKNGKKQKPKKPKYEKSQRNNERQNSRMVVRVKNEWFCFEDLLLKQKESFFEEEDFIYGIQANGNYLNAIICRNPEERLRYFQTAAEFLDYMKMNKVFASEDVLFCAESINKYYIYDEILSSPNLLKDIRIIKRKSDHFVFWSKYNPYVDVRVNLL